LLLTIKPMFDNFGSLETSIQEKIESDADFQTEIADLSDEDKETAIKTKKSELLDIEIKTLAEKADKVSKAEEIANNQKKRAEKAEQELKNKKPDANKIELTTKDTIALMNAKVHEDDIDDVVDYAKYKGISVTEALKSSVVKSSLAEKEEQRKTALAIQTGNKRPTNQKVSDQELVEKANKGELPAKGSEEADRLFWIRRGGKR